MQGDNSKAPSTEEKNNASGLKDYLMNELINNFKGELKNEQEICDQVRKKLTAYLNEEHPDPQKILDILCEHEKANGDEE